VVSNATRWDTFEGLMPQRELPKSEQLFRARYKKSPSFLSIHMGVRADVFGPVSVTRHGCNLLRSVERHAVCLPGALQWVC
jgi:prolycopene isomerase